MKIDVPTLVVALVMTCLMQVVALSTQFRAHGTRHGLRWWTLGNAVMAVGWAISFLRSIPSLRLLAITANVPVVLLGFAFFYVGIHQFYSRKARLGPLVAILTGFTLVHLYFAIVRYEYSLRAANFELGVAVFGFLIARVCWSQKTRPLNSSERLFAAVFIFGGIYFSTLALATLLGRHGEDLFSQSPLQIAGYITVLGLYILWTTAFILMLKQQAEESLRASEARYRFLTENMVDVVWTLDPKTGRFTYVSPSVEQLRGYTPEEVMAEPVDAALVGEGRSPRILSVRIDQPRRDGSLVPTEVVTKLITDDDGRIVEVLGVTRDISDRVRADEQFRTLHVELEQRVKERTSALTEANRELESFSYTVSHDLRAPLRAINGYTSLLSRHNGGALDEEGQHLLQAISDNGLLMGSLVDGLLDFTRTRSMELKRVPLDMKELAEAVVTDLASAAERKGVRTSVADLPPVHADRDLVAAALRHLLTNAIRFSAGKPDPLVEVGFEPGAGTPVYFVRDNGIGFDAKYADRLFRIFERLDGPPEAGETGIGLALVKRIVEKHGGTVRAEGVVGKGATFFFTLGPSITDPGVTATG